MYPKFIKRLESDAEPSAYVRDEEEHMAQLIGWGVPLPGESEEVAAIVAEKTKEELQALCDERGIEYDKRWGVAKLQEALQA